MKIERSWLDSKSSDSFFCVATFTAAAVLNDLVGSTLPDWFFWLCNSAAFLAAIEPIERPDDDDDDDEEDEEEALEMLGGTTRVESLGENEEVRLETLDWLRLMF